VQLQGVQHHFHVQNRVLEPEAPNLPKNQRGEQRREPESIKRRQCINIDE